MEVTSVALDRSETRSRSSKRTCQMKRVIIATAMSLCVLSLAAISSADTLIMRDGARVEGTVVGIAGRTITFRHADGVSRRVLHESSRGAGICFRRAREPARGEQPQARGAGWYAARRENGRTDRLPTWRGGSTLLRHCRRAGHERVGPRDYSREVQRTTDHSTNVVRRRDRQP